MSDAGMERASMERSHCYCLKITSVKTAICRSGHWLRSGRGDAKRYMEVLLTFDV